MMGRLRAWWGNEKPAPITDTQWQSVCGRLPLLDGLNEQELHNLRTLCVAFLASKTFTAPDGFQLTDEICLSIAVQGCLPVLNIGLDWYRGWHGIIVYPNEFVIPRELVDENGIVHRYDEIAAGEAWSDGPLILSWSDAQMTDGEYNVVIHEFAHKIDMINGDADGCPPLQKNQSNATWRQIWQGAFENYCARVDTAPTAIFEDENDEAFEDIELDSAIDPYAAESPGEFFAVCSEVFFTTPYALQAEYLDVYQQLALLYRQDPATRLKPPNA